MSYHVVKLWNYWININKSSAENPRGVRVPAPPPPRHKRRPHACSHFLGKICILGRLSREEFPEKVLKRRCFWPISRDIRDITKLLFLCFTSQMKRKKKKRGGRTRIDRGSKLIEKFPRSDRESPNKMVPKWQKFLRKGVYIMWKSPGKGLWFFLDKGCHVIGNEHWYPP